MRDRNKILIVDDKGINRYMLGEIFKDQYEIIEAPGGQEALYTIDEEYDNIAVMLLDIIMPVVDGFGVLEYMKEEGYIDKFPVVIVTDDSSEETSVKAFEYNVSDMVIKPFEPRIIKRRVQNIIELYEYKRKYGNSL
ncbi:MAG: response regulator transcription factor [Lachnospiraceae bacterium]|nr:response regulator transcription factor [Lachnospiraceae bacterium]